MPKLRGVHNGLYSYINFAITSILKKDIVTLRNSNSPKFTIISVLSNHLL